jgi:hypothetical protein
VAERGNDATRLRGWTDVNAARPLVHGAAYFSVLADALARTGDGDLVLFMGWRGDLAFRSLPAGRDWCQGWKLGPVWRMKVWSMPCSGVPVLGPNDVGSLASVYRGSLAR